MKLQRGIIEINVYPIGISFFYFFCVVVIAAILRRRFCFCLKDFRRRCVLFLNIAVVVFVVVVFALLLSLSE